MSIACLTISKHNNRPVRTEITHTASNTLRLHLYLMSKMTLRENRNKKSRLVKIFRGVN